MPFKYDDQGALVTQEAEVGGKKLLLPVFVHADGKETAFEPDQTVGRIKALNAEAQGHREAKERAESTLKAFTDSGLTSEAAKAAAEALQKIKDIDDGKLIQAGKVEEIRTAAQRAAEQNFAAQKNAYEQQIATNAKELERLTTALHTEIVGGSFGRSKFIADKLAIPADMAQAFFGRHFKVEEGKLVAYDGAGQKIGSRLRPGDLNPDFDEALEILVDTYPNKASILKGSGAAGGGAPQGGGAGGGNGKTIRRSEWERIGDPAERAKVLQEKQLVDG